jgi:hypothetical protein
MRGCLLWLGLLALAGQLRAAEHKFDFSNMPTNQPPVGCVSTVAGEGKPGSWKLLLDEVTVPSTDSNAPTSALKTVVAQTASDKTDEHYPLLILSDDLYNDFTFTVRVKIVGGTTEQMAGIAFRMNDDRDFYVLRINALNKNVRFYQFTRRGEKVYSADANVVKDKWYELSVKCTGSTLNFFLDGNEVLPPFTEAMFSSGKVGLFTKSDSISYFADARIQYTPRESFVQQLVHETMKQYPRVLGLKLFMVPPKATEARLVASDDLTPIGQPGEKCDADVIKRGVNYYRKDKDMVTITLPLRDRNGDPVAAVRLSMKTFPGQTEDNALVRAMPILKSMQERAAAAASLTE